MLFSFLIDEIMMNDWKLRLEFSLDFLVRLSLDLVRLGRTYLSIQLTGWRT